MKKVGLWLVIAALLVNGPRFILVFLRVDNIDLPLQTEAIMLGATRSEANLSTNQAASNGKMVTQPALAPIQSQDQIGAANGTLNGSRPATAAVSRITKDERQKLLLDLLRPLSSESEIQADQLAKQLGVSRQSIYRDLRELKQHNLLTVDDDGSLATQSRPS